MYKKVLLITSILIIGGCAGKKDFTQGVSEEDKKLLSSSKDEVLYIYKDEILITKNGFYPNMGRFHEKVKDKYTTKIANYSQIKKFDLRKFMNDVNKNKLKRLRNKIFFIRNKLPSINLRNYSLKEIDALSSKNISLLDRQKLAIKKDPLSIYKIINSNETLQRMVLKKDYTFIKHIINPTDTIKKYSKVQSRIQEKECDKRKGRDDGYFTWDYHNSWYRTCGFHSTNYTSTPSSNDSSYSSGSSSGGSSSSGGHYRVQTVYVPGGNGRTGQTRVWVND